MATIVTNPLLEAALRYAELGWPVVPLQWPVGDGCSCDKGAACQSVGKHPLTSRGLRDASTSPSIIRAAWDRWPQANIGIVAGAEAGLAIVDVDGDEGEGSLAAIYGEYGVAPDTVTSVTGRGYHLLFEHPGGETRVPPAVGIAPKLDIRGDGSYIVAPPSRHASGAIYKWAKAPGDVPLAPLPKWVMQLIARRAARVHTNGNGNGNGKSHLADSAPIPQGQRNTTLYRIACAFRRQGMDEAEILEALHGINKRRCTPDPLPEDELLTIARSATKHQPHEQGALAQAHGADHAPAGRGPVWGAGRPPQPAAPSNGKPAGPRRPIMEDRFIDKLPAHCFPPLLRRYIDVVGPCTEASDTYHLASFLAVFGIALGRTVWKVYAGKLYPNLYVALIGDSGSSRKSTAARFATDLLQRLAPEVNVIRGIGSAEGLVHEMAGAEMSPDEVIALHERLESPPAFHRRSLIFEDEISNFLFKAHRESSGALIQRAVEAYDSNATIEHTLKKGKLIARNPVLGFLGGSNVLWLEASSKPSDLMGGFSNRFLFFDGKPKTPIPQPPSADDAAFNGVLSELKTRLNAFRQRPEEALFSAEASARWDGWYHDFYTVHASSPVIETLMQRVPTNALKLATLYAILDFTHTIELQHLEAALAVVHFSGRAMTEALSGVAGSERAAIDLKIQRLLRKRKMTARLLQASIFNCSMEEIQRALKAMEAAGMVVAVPTPSGRSVEYQWLDDVDAGESADAADVASAAENSITVGV